MKSTNKKTSTKRTRLSKSQTATTANAQAQTSTASTPGAALPPPTAPPRHKLTGFVNEVGTDGWVKGNLSSLRAAYSPRSDVGRISFNLEDYRSIQLNLDHVLLRAAIGNCREALSEVSRFHSGRHAETYSNHPPRPQLTCYRMLAASGGDDEIRYEFLPDRDLIQLEVRFSGAGARFVAWIYLTRPEAEALLHDLERALADLEHYGDVGEI